MRCASILRLAKSMDIEPDGIAAFVDEQGGIVECYNLDRKLHPAATANRSKSDPIEPLRHTARSCDSTALRHLVPEGPITALLEVDQDGDILLLGARTATQSDIKRYKTAAKSTASDNAVIDAEDVAPADIAQAEPALAS
jgi:hypothetical protein